VRTRANFDHNNTENQEKLFKNMIVFANKSLLKGHILKKSDLELAIAKKNVGTGIFNAIEDLVGRKLKQNVSLGFPIRSRHLHLEWVINKGDKINIIQSAGGIDISASGVALENGQKGEKIKVMNLSSEKNLVAWVINEKKVSIKAKINSN
jgi:flagella basal body P-ring formation protein FlgA